MLSDSYKKLDTFDRDLARMIPRSVNIEPHDPKSLQIADEMRQLYFNGQKISMENLAGMGKLQTDYHFVIGTHLAAELHARNAER